MIDAALLLPKILARAGEKHELAEAAAKIAWLRIAGDGLRNHAVALRLSGETLMVAVADTVWQKQLRDMSPELIYRINKLLGRETVKFIEFRIDPAALTSGRRTGKPAAGQPLPANIVSAAADIEDVELRDRFIRAAANCIHRRESSARNPNSAI